MTKTLETGVLVGKKGTNSKLRDWYIGNFAVTKDEDKLRKIYITNLDIQNAVGTVLVTTFAPYVLPLVPVGRKIAKDGRLAIYDAVKKGIDNNLGIYVTEDHSDNKGFLDDKELGKVEKVTGKIVDKMGGKGK